MKLKEFIYDLPKELIAQVPLKKRDASRLMIMDRSAGNAEVATFRDILKYVKKGDCVVFNDTRVIPVRFYGKRATGGKVEIFLLNPWEKSLEALVRPSKKVKEGEVVEIEKGISVTVKGRTDIGRFVEFNVPVPEALKVGHVPLPPYIAREDNDEDKETYQTVYARKPGATASPTAGLHFTEELISEIKDKGAEVVYVTLHTSYGTFAPVSTEEIEDHPMHEEYYELNESAAMSINSAKKNGGRVLAVGTTSVRVLETAATEDGRVEPGSGMTSIFIYPGYKFKIIDGIVTNFHLPGSTLLMLVSAFSNREFVIKTYEQAIKEKFRFFSYGDAMLIV